MYNTILYTPKPIAVSDARAKIILIKEIMVF
jgi:hypothetical protein